MGNPLPWAAVQAVTILHFLGKKLFLMSTLSLLKGNLNPSSRVLSLVPWEKRPTPSGSNLLCLDLSMDPILKGGKGGVWHSGDVWWFRSCIVVGSEMAEVSVG